MAITSKLRNDPLWQEVFRLAESMYDNLQKLENFPEEKWTTEAKLRGAAFDTLFYLAYALASGEDNTSGVLFDWNNARRSLFALQTVYLFACKQQFLTLEPEIVVQMDQLLQKYKARIDTACKEQVRRDQADKEYWLKKHHLWKEMH